MLYSCGTGVEVALREDSDAIVKTVIAEKLGENGLLDDAFYTQEQALFTVLANVPQYLAWLVKRW